MKSTSQRDQILNCNVCCWHLADLLLADRNVRFDPKGKLGPVSRIFTDSQLLQLDEWIVDM
jgi:hypothetical protein